MLVHQLHWLERHYYTLRSLLRAATPLTSISVAFLVFLKGNLSVTQ
jgi:hypothetical protein